MKTTRNLRPKFSHGFAIVSLRAFVIGEPEWQVIEAHARWHRDSGSLTWTTEDSLAALLNRGIRDEERRQADELARAATDDVEEAGIDGRPADFAWNGPLEPQKT